MSMLLQLADQLRDVHAEISRIERVVATHQGSKALLIDFQSMDKRRRLLETEFNVLANNLELDVMRYRLLPESGRPISLRAVTRVLDRFQTAVSTVYDAIKFGPKQKVKLSAEVLAESGLDFGYTYSGSLGVVLTVPNERMLIDRSKFDMAVVAFFEIAEAATRAEVIEFARKYGIASVRRIYDWSSAHADFNIAADINLMRSSASRERLQVAPSELRKLKGIIEETNDLEDEIHSMNARLAGLDVDKQTFHLVVDGGGDIEGKWADTFALDASHVLDKMYAAELVKRTKVYYALEREETDWLLRKATVIPI